MPAVGAKNFHAAQTQRDQHRTSALPKTFCPTLTATTYKTIAMPKKKKKKKKKNPKKK